MLGQFQAVGAGYRNAGVLQSLDHRVEGVAAPPHQHQHVPIAQRPAPACAARRRAAFHQSPDLALNSLGELYLGARLRQSIERRAPAFDVLLCVRLLQLPQLDQARSRIGQ